MKPTNRTSIAAWDNISQTLEDLGLIVWGAQTYDAQATRIADALEHLQSTEPRLSQRQTEAVCDLLRTVYHVTRDDYA